MGDLSPGPRRLCELARGAYEPPPGAKSATRQALGIKLATAAIVTATAAAPKAMAAGMATTAGKLLVVSIAVVGAGVGVYYGGERLTRTEPSAVAIPASGEHRARQPEPREALHIIPADSAVPVSSFRAEAPTRSRPNASRLPASGAESSPAEAAQSAATLERETALLREVHAALRNQAPARALALLSEHDERAGGSSLAPERAAARIIALCQLGSVEQARAEADRFAATWPRSPLLPRVNAVCRAPSPAAATKP